jgi:hypothetical protein
MLYAILCYDDETAVEAAPKEKIDALIAKRRVVTNELAARGKLGPVARLMPTTAAVSIRSGREPFVVDGPFAETKEQLLGFYVVDCDSLEQAIGVAKELGVASATNGCFEIRPLMVFHPNKLENAQTP